MLLDLKSESCHWEPLLEIQWVRIAGVLVPLFSVFSNINYVSLYMGKYLWKYSSQFSAISVLLLKCQENRPHKMTFISSGSEDSQKKMKEKHCDSDLWAKSRQTFDELKSYSRVVPKRKEWYLKINVSSQASQKKGGKKKEKKKKSTKYSNFKITVVFYLTLGMPIPM